MAQGYGSAISLDADRRRHHLLIESALHGAFQASNEGVQDALSATPDGPHILGIEGAVPVEGGVPIVISGKFVGAIGVLAGASQQDGQCAQASANALLTH
jgi:glc operon protein GlcG